MHNACAECSDRSSEFASIKGRLEMVLPIIGCFVSYVLKNDAIGDMKDMVGMSDQMRGLSVLMDGV